MQATLIQNDLGNMFQPYSTSEETQGRSDVKGVPYQTLAEMMGRSDKMQGFPHIGQWTEGQDPEKSPFISRN
ncbi:MAG: hypothetical protein V1746_04490 [bacterium]